MDVRARGTYAFSHHHASRRLHRNTFAAAWKTDAPEHVGAVREDIDNIHSIDNWLQNAVPESVEPELHSIVVAFPATLPGAAEAAAEEEHRPVSDVSREAPFARRRFDRIRTTPAQQVLQPR